MNASVKNLANALALLLILTIQSFAQARFDPQGIVHNSVARLIQAKYSSGYSFHYVMFDAQIRQALHDQERYGLNAKIGDPYRTLKGCILFSAYKSRADSVPKNFIIGMIRNGQIIWDNYPGSGVNLSDDNSYGTLLFSRDINGDHEVDLIFGDYQLDSPSDLQASFTYIRILSWNGEQGRFISGSMIGSGSDELLDVGADGVMELREQLLTQVETTWPEFKTSSFPYVTYGWNGSQYGLWPNVKQYAKSEFLPADIFKAEVRCEVTCVKDSIVYSYSLSNERTSVQKIDNFYVDNADNISSESAPEHWSAGVSSLSGSTVYYANYGNAGLASGKTLNDLKVTSMAPPSIVNYYLRGYTGGVTCCPTASEEYHNLLTNSVTGYTLGTRNATVTLGALNFLDTLISYKHRSVALGWLGNDKSRERECERTVRSRGWYREREDGKSRTWKVEDSWDFDKNWNNGMIGILDKRLEKAKQALTRGDSVKARRELQIFVMEVELVYDLGERPDVRGKKQDVGSKKSEIRGRKAVLTSEAYALLKYNAEYLIDRLPAGHGKGRK